MDGFEEYFRHLAEGAELAKWAFFIGLLNTVLLVALLFKRSPDRKPTTTFKGQEIK